MKPVDSHYVSEFTSWLNDTIAQNPTWQTEQLTGRSLWWDKLGKRPESEDAPTVQAKPYPYDVNFNR